MENINAYLKSLSRTEAREIIVSTGIHKDLEKILLMRYCDNLSYDEISERLYLTYNSVGNKLSKARKELVRKLI